MIDILYKMMKENIIHDIQIKSQNIIHEIFQNVYVSVFYPIKNINTDINLIWRDNKNAAMIDAMDLFSKLCIEPPRKVYIKKLSDIFTGMGDNVELSTIQSYLYEYISSIIQSSCIIDDMGISLDINNDTCNGNIEYEVVVKHKDHQYLDTITLKSLISKNCSDMYPYDSSIFSSKYVWLWIMDIPVYNSDEYGYIYALTKNEAVEKLNFKFKDSEFKTYTIVNLWDIIQRHLNVSCSKLRKFADMEYDSYTGVISAGSNLYTFRIRDLNHGLILSYTKEDAIRELLCTTRFSSFNEDDIVISEVAFDDSISKNKNIILL